MKKHTEKFILVGMLAIGLALVSSAALAYEDSEIEALKQEIVALEKTNPELAGALKEELVQAMRTGEIKVADEKFVGRKDGLAPKMEGGSFTEAFPKVVKKDAPDSFSRMKDMSVATPARENVFAKEPVRDPFIKDKTEAFEKVEVRQNTVEAKRDQRANLEDLRVKLITEAKAEFNKGNITEKEVVEKIASIEKSIQEKINDLSDQILTVKKDMNIAKAEANDKLAIQKQSEYDALLKQQADLIEQAKTPEQKQAEAEAAQKASEDKAAAEKQAAADKAATAEKQAAADKAAAAAQKAADEKAAADKAAADKAAADQKAAADAKQQTSAEKDAAKAAADKAAADAAAAAAAAQAAADAAKAAGGGCDPKLPACK